MGSGTSSHSSSVHNLDRDTVSSNCTLKQNPRSCAISQEISADKNLRAASAATKKDFSPLPLSHERNVENGSFHSNSSLICVEAVLGVEGSDAKYIKKRPLGKGAFGETFIVERNLRYDPSANSLAEKQLQVNTFTQQTHPGCLYVAKILDLRFMNLQDRRYVQTEIICLAHTFHFAIIKYYEHYFLESGNETMIILTELANHGDLSGNLNRAKRCLPDSHSGENNPSLSLRLTEREAGMYFVQILLALHHVHARRMIHRDVKSANLFLTSHGFIKLGDFGFSQKYESTVSSETIAGTFLGTPYYLSPEMWEGKRYGKKADVWAAGVVLYEMLMDGHRPFDATTLTELREAVLCGEVCLPEHPSFVEPRVDKDLGAIHDKTAAVDGVSSTQPPKRGRFSSEMRELVQSIFVKNPNERPSAEALLRTPIMQHYFFLLEKHVRCLIAADTKAYADNPSCPASALAFPDPAEKALTLHGIEEAKLLLNETMQRKLQESGQLHYEGVVFKCSYDGTWKKRYLVLADGVLIISLSCGKEAADGSERSRKVSLNMIKSVTRSLVPCIGGNSASVAAAETEGTKPSHAFVLLMAERNQPILFGVASEEDLNQWINCIMNALNIN